MPTVLQKLEGCLTDPPVSEPIEIAAISALTEAAEPPDDPPETLVVSSGFFVTPK